MGQRCLEVGDSVALLVRPENPDQAILPSSNQYATAVSMAVTSGFVLVLFGTMSLVFYIQAKRRQAKQAVNKRRTFVGFPRSFSLEMEDGAKTPNADWQTVQDGLQKAVENDSYFILVDSSDSSGLTYYQGYPGVDDEPWHMEYQDGSLDAHFAADVPGDEAKRQLHTWMDTGEWPTGDAWQRIDV